MKERYRCTKNNGLSLVKGVAVMRLEREGQSIPSKVNSVCVCVCAYYFLLTSFMKERPKKHTLLEFIVVIMTQKDWKLEFNGAFSKIPWGILRTFPTIC